MLYINRIDISEGIECIICHYWYFVNKGLKSRSDVCKGCHAVIMMSMNFSDIAILSIHGVDYCCIINGINQNEAIAL